MQEFSNNLFSIPPALQAHVHLSPFLSATPKNPTDNQWLKITHYTWIYVTIKKKRSVATSVSSWLQTFLPCFITNVLNSFSSLHKIALISHAAFWICIYCEKIRCWTENMGRRNIIVICILSIGHHKQIIPAAAKPQIGFHKKWKILPCL